MDKGIVDGMAADTSYIDQIPEIPERSHLYNMEPIGIGTIFVQSLTSYVHMLAENHCVTVGTLLIKEIIPTAGNQTLTESLRRGSSRLFPGASFSLNGSGKNATDLSAAIEKLTMRDDLKNLTMLKFGNSIPTIKRFESHKKWCPVCYEESIEKGDPVYDPLILCFKAINHCPKHHLPLETTCFYCGHKKISFIEKNTNNGYCPKCYRWIGMPQDQYADHVNKYHKEQVTLKWDLEAIKSIIEAIPSIQEPPKPVNFTASMIDFIKNSYNGSISSFADDFVFSDSTVEHWCKTKTQPSLKYLAQLAYISETPLADILLKGKFNLPNRERWLEVRNTVRPAFFRRNIIDKEKIRRHLESILTDFEKNDRPSLTKIAQDNGYNRATLYKHFPELCFEISTKYLAYTRVQKTTRLKEATEIVNRTIRELHTKGLYPSYDRIEALSDKKAILREIEVRDIWVETLRELGITKYSDKKEEIYVK